MMCWCVNQIVGFICIKVICLQILILCCHMIGNTKFVIFKFITEYVISFITTNYFSCVVYLEISSLRFVPKHAQFCSKVYRAMLISHHYSRVYSNYYGFRLHMIVFWQVKDWFHLPVAIILMCLILLCHYELYAFGYCLFPNSWKFNYFISVNTQRLYMYCTDRKDRITVSISAQAQSKHNTIEHFLNKSQFLNV